METENIAEGKQLAKQNLSQGDIEILQKVHALPEEINPEMTSFFLRFCKESNLNPFKRQVYIVPRKKKKSDGTFETTYTIQTGIDGYRAIASRTGTYAGSDDAILDDEKKLTKATVTVYRMVAGQRCPFTASARWKEYYPGEKLGFLWDSKPAIMLSKCAESLALRKGFPEELSGIYIDEEMQQADIINISPKKNELPPKETNGENKISPISDGIGEGICANCGVVIKSKKVIENSMKEFGKVLCWKNQNDCQEVVRNAQKADAEFSVPEFESEEEI